jgi:hypothetical protein
MASRGKESKLDESVWEWTVGRMGGARVRAARPAQLNPWVQKCASRSNNVRFETYPVTLYRVYFRVFFLLLQVENVKVSK